MQPSPTSRNTLPPDVRVDTYTQQAASKIDVLWVIDNSGSMAPRQENLARNFQSFITEFTKNSIDYRIAVTTTDIFKEAGRFVGTPKILSPTTPNVAAVFANNVKVGINGSPYEVGLEAARLALDLQTQANAAAVMQCQAACPTTGQAVCRANCATNTAFQFLRRDAYLYLIFVSDEEDRSSQDVRFFYRYFETVKGVGNDGTVTTAAIMGDTPTNTCGATPGARYKALSDLTGGEVGSICDANFSATLGKLARNAVGLKRKFALQVKPNVQTISGAAALPLQRARRSDRRLRVGRSHRLRGQPGRLDERGVHAEAGRARRLDIRRGRQPRSSSPVNRCPGSRHRSSFSTTRKGRAREARFVGGAARARGVRQPEPADGVARALAARLAGRLRHACRCSTRSRWRSP